ncbi:hypothetical protein TELCIR_06739, partial [Teladorsagia circumcincta]
DGRIKNLTQPDMAKETVRLLQYVGTPESNNFKYVTQNKRKFTSKDDGYEFLGEADIDNRIMQYVFQGHVHVVDKGQFLSKEYFTALKSHENINVR